MSVADKYIPHRSEPQDNNCLFGCLSYMDECTRWMDDLAIEEAMISAVVVVVVV